MHVGAAVDLFFLRSLCLTLIGPSLDASADHSGAHEAMDFAYIQ